MEILCLCFLYNSQAKDAVREYFRMDCERQPRDIAHDIEGIMMHLKGFDIPLLETNGMHEDYMYTPSLQLNNFISLVGNERPYSSMLANALNDIITYSLSNDIDYYREW